MPGRTHLPRPWAGTEPEAPLQVSWRRLPGQLSSTGGSEHLFCSLYGSQSPADTFWLDRWRLTSQLPAPSRGPPARARVPSCACFERAVCR